MQLEHVQFFRKTLLPILRLISPDQVTIAHHWTGNPFVLNPFMHRGYWFYGKRRERNTMLLFGLIIKQGDTVVEIGGHIGYLTQYFASLVGEGGIVYVFEPGENNLPYLKKNILDLGSNSIVLVESAISNKSGFAKFYLEYLTGQNNSLLFNYHATKENIDNAYMNPAKKTVMVKTITLDEFCEKNRVRPDFVKIDIEGAENLAIEGSKMTIDEHKPAFMIEITENCERIMSAFAEHGYVAFNDKRLQIKNRRAFGNTFFLHKSRHAKHIAKIELSRP